MNKRLRLSQSADFERLRQIGRTHKHASLLLSYLETDTGHNRYGVIVPKRIGKAVVRNRVRRRIKAILQALHPTLKQGYDCVLVVRSGLAEKPFPELVRIITQLFQQARLLEKDTTP